MARSIHETRKSWSRLRRFDYSSPKEKDAALHVAVRRLWKKRRVKDAVRRERRTDPPPLEPASVSTIPIHVDDEGPLVHHGASGEDVRAFLQFMPASVTDGIEEVRLCLGAAYMEESGDGTDERDPYLRRLGSEHLRGLFAPPVLGLYRPMSGKIAVFAYVWDRDASSPLPSFVLEFYLRLRSLSVLVHEVAHHHDHACRIARGRWLSDRKETFENYAERMEWAWMRDFVIPYIETKYASEWQAVREWIWRLGGAAPTLELMAGDPRYTNRNGWTKLGVSTADAVRDLMKAVAEGKNLLDSRLAYAWGLHYADEYERCLQISTDLVGEEPESVPALTLHADTLEHLERFEEALAQVDHALSLDPCYAQAWQVRVRLMEGMKRWSEMLEACDRWLAELGSSKRAILAHRARAVALCALERSEEMETALSAGIPKRAENDPKIKESIRRLVFKRASKEQSKSPQM
jgi:tetratricopeptide (TPR) repeat protein